ncbi:MAG: hypothetical protein ACKO7G_06800, partial [Gammaproteobacteria bacterium]
MDTYAAPPRTCSPLAAILALVAALLTGCTTPGGDAAGGAASTASAPPPVTDASFCRDAQQTIVGTRLAADNEVITGFDAFAKSKPTARPLQTRQFVHHED